MLIGPHTSCATNRIVIVIIMQVLVRSYTRVSKKSTFIHVQTYGYESAAQDDGIYRGCVKDTSFCLSYSN